MICCRATAAAAMERMRAMMSQLKLTVNETKTRECHVPDETFDFLGYTLRPLRRSPDGPVLCGGPSVAEEDPPAVPGDQRSDRAVVAVALRGRTGRPPEPNPSGMVERLQPRDSGPSLPSGEPPRGGTAPSMVMREAQGAEAGLHTIPEPSPVPGPGTGEAPQALARDQFVSEGGEVSCPRAGCGRSARPVR